MNTVNSWADVVMLSLQDMWFKISAYFPQIIAALFLLILGLLVSVALGNFAKRLFTFTKIDKLNEKMGVKKELEQIGLKFTFADLVGTVVRWFFIVITLIAIVDILKIPELTQFLRELALYLPNVAIAVVIFSIGLAAGTFIHNLTEKALVAASMPDTSVKLMSNITKWAIFAFALMASLVQLGVATSLIQILFAGVVIMFALAGGIAFGLGGRDKAQVILERIASEFIARKKEEEKLEEQ
jgi:hypothetical protein